MLDFTPDVPPNPPILSNDEIPKGEMELYCRSESSFLPEGKTFADLTEEELKELQSKYRFSPLKPSTYQGITGRKK